MAKASSHIAASVQSSTNFGMAVSAQASRTRGSAQV